MQRILGIAAMMCFLFLMFFGVSALADESMQVRIPVIASGSSCTVELFDEQGHRVQMLNLQAGVESAFVVECVGLKRFTYTAMVSNKDTAYVDYDHRNYRITIDLVYDENGELAAMVFIENLTSNEAKLPKLVFINTPKARFTFTKRWSGGQEATIDWDMFHADGTPMHKLFYKQIISENEWQYEATFYDDVSDCYIIETPIDGYLVMYKNVGKYSDVTDRCHNGGTILNYKVPQTSDETSLSVYVMTFLGATLLLGVMLVCRRKKA